MMNRLSIWFSYKQIFLGAVILCFLTNCQRKERTIHRPIDPWAFRSVLDKQPRMLTLALDSSCYVAYDLAHCTIFKAWKGGVILEGAAYTDKKNVQPQSWGMSYFVDSLHTTHWRVEVSGSPQVLSPHFAGYGIREGSITLWYEIPIPGRDTIFIHERPEFIRSKEGEPGLERIFTLRNAPEGVVVSLVSNDTSIALQGNTTTKFEQYFSPLPMLPRPRQEAQYDHRGRYWIEKSDCLTCHEREQSTVGPSFQEIAQRYPKEKTAIQYLIRKVKTGGDGVWGQTPMNSHDQLADREIAAMIDYILSLRVTTDAAPMAQVVNTSSKSTPAAKPGFGAPLAGVHPSFNVTSLHSSRFKPRVGGLAFLPDGRLLVTTWDSTGSVYVVSGVETGDSTRVAFKRIASGLAEPLGITVVGSDIYVMQKQELTRLVDSDGDDIIDRYEVVCNGWGVTADFHEFGFGLVHQDDHFYVTLSMAMRLMAGEKQQPDRGKTLKIGLDGRYEPVDFGLRTPNGIGVGPDNELFLTDNQGEWLPANKLIHIKQGAYHGMRWGLPDSLVGKIDETPPAIWMPEDEIANSPSQPVLIPDGPYRGQMLHGDVTHGGIKRDFLEKIDGEYQGAVFRFTQGLAAGVNRLCWGPDGALYIGEVGMVGGWSWHEKQYGLQRMTYTGNPVFEMLAIRATSDGFEIEFTEPVSNFDPETITLQQWWYLPTSSYGGPKKDLAYLSVSEARVSADGRRVALVIPGRKPGYVVYFRLAEDLLSKSGRSLWSAEAWYTLNSIPEKAQP